MSVSARQIAERAHPRAFLSGGLGVFASFLALAWALFGYNLPSAVKIVSSQSQTLMLLQVGLAFVTFAGGGLMLARYTAIGGTVNVLGALGTFILGIYYSTGLANVAQAHNMKSLSFHISSFYSSAYTGTIDIPIDRIVPTLMIVPVLPIALLLLISGLGALGTYRSTRKIAPN